MQILIDFFLWKIRVLFLNIFSSQEDEEAARVREERLAAYAAKKVSKPGPIAKSQIMLDVKPWDDETDMKALEDAVRTIEMDGLKWGASKFSISIQITLITKAGVN